MLNAVPITGLTILSCQEHVFTSGRSRVNDHWQFVAGLEAIIIPILWCSWMADIRTKKTGSRTAGGRPMTTARNSVLLDDLGCAAWFAITLVIIVVVLHQPHLHKHIPPLLDFPNEKSHPSWKSSSNVCQKSNPTSVIRA